MKTVAGQVAIGTGEADAVTCFFHNRWVEWRHVGAAEPMGSSPQRNTVLLGKCRWDEDGLEEFQDLRDLMFRRWRWGILQGWRWYEHEYHPMYVYHGIAIDKKTPFKISVSLQQESQATARTFGWGDANGGLVCRCPQSFSGKALRTLWLPHSTVFQTNYQWNGLRFSCRSSLDVVVHSFFGMAREGCKLDCNSSCRIACCFEFSTLSFCRSVYFLKQRSKYLPQ